MSGEKWEREYDWWRARGDPPLSSLQVPGILSRMRANLLSYLRHVQWLRRVSGSSLRQLEPELGTLQLRLDQLLRRLQLLVGPRARHTPLGLL